MRKLYLLQAIQNLVNVIVLTGEMMKISKIRYEELNTTEGITVIISLITNDPFSKPWMFWALKSKKVSFTISAYFSLSLLCYLELNVKYCDLKLLDSRVKFTIQSRFWLSPPCYGGFRHFWTKRGLFHWSLNMCLGSNWMISHIYY